VFRLGGNGTASAPPCAVPLSVSTIELATGVVSAPVDTVCVVTEGSFEGGALATTTTTTTTMPTTVGVSSDGSAATTLETLVVLSEFERGTLNGIVVHSSMTMVRPETFKDPAAGPQIKSVKFHDRSSDDAGLVAFGRGHSPVATVGADGAVIVVAGGSYCFNSDFHNKRSNPRVCTADPIAQPVADGLPAGRAIGYWFAANVAAFSRALSRDAGVVTPCDDDVLQGIVGVGESPSVALGRATGTGAAAVLAVAHDGIPAGFVEADGCGFQVPESGRVVESLNVTGIMRGFGIEVGVDDVRASARPGDQDNDRAANHRGAHGTAAPVIRAPIAARARAVRAGGALCTACRTFFDALDAAVLEADGVDTKVAELLTKICPVAKELFVTGDRTTSFCENVVYTYVPDLISSVAVPSETICTDLGAC
jgi:hypothetical protein